MTGYVLQQVLDERGQVPPCVFYYRRRSPRSRLVHSHTIYQRSAKVWRTRDGALRYARRLDGIYAAVPV